VIRRQYGLSVESFRTCLAGAGDVSVDMDAMGADGAAVTSVHPRAASHSCIAAAAAAPVNGWGRSLTITAGRHVALSMWRPVAVMTSDPLWFSGAELS
jgi:hypothetical protein